MISLNDVKYLQSPLHRFSRSIASPPTRVRRECLSAMINVQPLYFPVFMRADLLFFLVCAKRIEKRVSLRPRDVLFSTQSGLQRDVSEILKERKKSRKKRCTIDLSLLELLIATSSRFDIARFDIFIFPISMAISFSSCTFRNTNCVKQFKNIKSCSNRTASSPLRNRGVTSNDI